MEAVAKLQNGSNRGWDETHTWSFGVPAIPTTLPPCNYAIGWGGESEGKGDQ